MTQTDTALKNALWQVQHLEANRRFLWIQLCRTGSRPTDPYVFRALVCFFVIFTREGNIAWTFFAWPRRWNDPSRFLLVAIRDRSRSEHEWFPPILSKHGHKIYLLQINRSPFHSSRSRALVWFSCPTRFISIVDFIGPWDPGLEQTRVRQ